MFWRYGEIPSQNKALQIIAQLEQKNSKTAIENDVDFSSVKTSLII